VLGISVKTSPSSNQTNYMFRYKVHLKITKTPSKKTSPTYKTISPIAYDIFNTRQRNRTSLLHGNRKIMRLLWELPEKYHIGSMTSQHQKHLPVLDIRGLPAPKLRGARARLPLVNQHNLIVESRSYPLTALLES
jgi:hypothetical protein